MKAQHTKGPWHVVQGDEWTSDIATDTPEQGVWTVASANNRRDEFEANKRLIAAAPDLLAALELCIEHMEWSTPQGERAFIAAKKAYAKATTESP